MISILFVDDEVNILDGIRNSLRKRLSQWHVEFAQSGEEALEILAKTHFDIIVSDMRMPKMDGATLLGIVQKEYPAICRFILTGQADKESILRAIPVTHQFMYKPCSPQDLLDLLDRTCNLHQRIRREEVRQIIGAARSIPSVPESSVKIAEIMANDNSSLTEIGDVIEHDPGLCARIIQVSNSAFCGRSKEVTSIREAVSIVGVECVQALALANQFFAETIDNRQCALLLKSTYAKGFEGFLCVANFMPKHPLRNVAMTSALLRDIGMIILAMTNPCEADYSFCFPDTGEMTVSEYEKCTFGASHADVAGHILELWGTPITVVEAVTFHHSVEESSIDPIIMTAVHVADVVVEYRSRSRDMVVAKLNWAYIDSHNLRETVEGWLDQEFENNKAA